MPNREDQACAMAAAHYRVESGITDIYRILASADIELRPEEPIKLLEVNQNTIAAGIMPIEFGPMPSEGFYYPTIIIEVTPAEFESIRRRELPLPPGWELGGQIPNPTATAVA